MQAETSSPRSNNLLAATAAILALALLAVLLFSLTVESRTPAAGSSVPSTAGRIAYLEFGRTADTLWLVNSHDPADRTSPLVIPHAQDFGVVPSLSPRGDRFAYTALPSETSGAGPDAPADLWLAELDAKAEPRLLAEGTDLLVEPLWTPGGDAIIYRRSAVTGQSLIQLNLDSEAETMLATSDTTSLFPAGFTPDGDTFFYVSVSETDGSRLHSLDVSTGSSKEVAQLSTGLTRDWALSPSATELAFLSIRYDPQEVLSRAHVVDLATGSVVAVSQADTAAFSPAWSVTGDLVLATLDRNGDAALTYISDGSVREQPGPQQGFDVPLYFALSGLIVRTFEGESLTAPGRSSLTLIDGGGERHPIATGEVTFLGWTRS